MSISVVLKRGDTIYETEALRHRQIRLLTILPIGSGENQTSPIRCVLKTVRLDDERPPIYTALSYTWGDSTNKVKIEVNGQDFEATKNLHSVLQHFRNTQDPVPALWVDAICINQNHNNEKEAQVRFMQSIFSGARETWAWVGQEADESSKAVDLINDLSHVYRNSCHGSNTDPENADKTQWGSLQSRGLQNHVAAFNHLLSSAYWYRVWIVQEIVMSKNLVFFYGRRKFFWDSLLFAVYLLDRHVGTRSIHSWSNKTDNFRGALVGIQRILSIQSVRKDHQENLRNDMRDTLLSLLSNHRSTGATEAKDKFIALAGLAVDDTEDQSADDSKRTKRYLTEIMTDGLYANMQVGAVYTFACHIITKEERHKPLDFLDSAGLPRNYPMPSWVPDWSVSTQSRPSPLLYWQLPTKKHAELVSINAPGKPRPLNSASFSIRDDAMLRATGRRVGSIQVVITAPSAKERLSECDANSRPRAPHLYLTGEHPADVLWKTLVLDHDLADGLRAPQRWGDVFYHNVSHQLSPSSPPSFLHQWWGQCKHFKLCGATLEELAIARNSSLPVQPFYPAEEFAQLKSAFTIGVGYRKLATSGNGYLCLVPLDARVGDIVVILVDCSAPVLLRQVEEEGAGYEFIGTCYVHGIMHGEAMDDLPEQDPFPEEFDIR